MALRRSFLLVLPVLLVASCAPPNVDLGDYTISCEEDSACPSGWECYPDGICQKVGTPLRCDQVCHVARDMCEGEPLVEDCPAMCAEYQDPAARDCFVHLAWNGVCHGPDLAQCAENPDLECFEPAHCEGNACEDGQCTDKPPDHHPCDDTCATVEDKCGADKYTECFDICRDHGDNQEARDCMLTQIDMGVCVLMGWRRCE